MGEVKPPGHRGLVCVTQREGQFSLVKETFRESGALEVENEAVLI